MRAGPGLLSREGLLTSAFFAAMFLPVGAHLPFWPLWLEARGLSAAEIGFFLSLGGLVRIAAGFALPVLAARFGGARAVLAAMLAASAAIYALHGLAEGRAALLALTLAASLAWAGLFPLGEGLGLAAARDAGFSYAQARGVGSLAFLLASLAVGSLARDHGSEAVRYWIVATLLLALPLALLHPGGAAGAAPAMRLAAMGRFALRREVLLLAGAIAAIQGSHAVLYALGSLHWRALGLDEGRIGALWAAAVVAETLLLVGLGPWIDRRLGPVRAIALAGAAGVLRWGAMSLDPAGWALWPLQCLHALTFATAHAGMMGFFRLALPAGLAAPGQGFVMQLCAGGALALGMAAGGALYPALGGATYALGAMLAAAGTLLALALGRAWRGGRIGPEAHG